MWRGEENMWKGFGARCAQGLAGIHFKHVIHLNLVHILTGMGVVISVIDI